MGQLWANGLVSETMNKGPQKQKRQATGAYNDKMLLWSGLLGLKRLKMVAPDLAARTHEKCLSVFMRTASRHDILDHSTQIRMIVS